MIEGQCSSSVEAGVPQGSLLDPLIFNEDLNDISKYAVAVFSMLTTHPYLR